MGKIWLKSVDPSRQCCACEGKSGPCSTCCSGIVLPWENFTGGSEARFKNAQFKDCIFLAYDGDVIFYSGDKTSIYSTGSITSFDVSAHSFSVPNGTTIEFSIKRQYDELNKPVSLETSFPELYRSSNGIYNVAYERAVAPQALVFIQEINNESGWYDIISSDGNGFGISSGSSQMVIEISGKEHIKLLASGERGLVDPVGFSTAPNPIIISRAIDQTFPQGPLFERVKINAYYAERDDPSRGLIPGQLLRGDPPSEDVNNYINPLSHPLDAIFHFTPIGGDFGPQIIDLVVDGSHNEGEPDAWNVVDDTMYYNMWAARDIVNAAAVTPLSNLPNYSKLIFGKIISPVVEIPPVTEEGDTTQISYTPSFELYYPSVWPTFNYSILSECKVTIKTKKNVCLAFYADGGSTQEESIEGRRFAETGYGSNTVERSYRFSITGNNIMDYTNTSNKNMSYNKLYMYSGDDTKYRIKCEDSRFLA